MKLRSNTQFSQAFKSDNFFSALGSSRGSAEKAERTWIVRHERQRLRLVL